MPAGCSTTGSSRAALLLGLLDAPLDVADGVEIFVELRADRRGRATRAAPPTSSVTESSMLRSCCIRARRAFGSVLPLSPNSRSNTTRGLFSIGSGVVALRQEMVFV